MRKTFIEANAAAMLAGKATAVSLPLMRKTFIEASRLTHRLILIRQVSSAYAEDFH